jgi:hypothetical protein
MRVVQGKVLFLLIAMLAVSGCKNKKPEMTGVEVTVKNANGEPVLSRVSIQQKAEGSQYPKTVTEAWVQPATTGTFIALQPGEYSVRAQGSGDSFSEDRVEVKKGKTGKVEIGFSTLVLDGTGLSAQGRVRVWKKLSTGGEQIVVTRLVRPNEQAALEFASGDYRVGFLKEGLTDEDKNFTPFGGELKLEAGKRLTVPVKP